MRFETDGIVRSIDKRVAHYYVLAVDNIQPVIVPEYFAVDRDPVNSQILALIVRLNPKSGVLNGNSANGYMVTLPEINTAWPSGCRTV
ncbi:hypothetical protein SDC9_127978 [bioreactor metagenome]|uniref:Uncharacterized protein n=1 Tax=bioreactor metagenome TaxID=1076179 RepID=A0A645CVI8_9ZZZZ